MRTKWTDGKILPISLTIPTNLVNLFSHSLLVIRRLMPEGQGPRALSAPAMSEYNSA